MKRRPKTHRRTCERTEADLLAAERERWATRPERDRELEEIARYRQKPIVRPANTTDFKQLCTSAQGQRLLELLQANDRAAATAPKCGECDDSRWKLIEQDGRRVAVRCPSCSQATTGTRNHADNVPIDYQAARFANYHVTPANRVARAAGEHWLSELNTNRADDALPHEVASGRDLMFVGGTGTGKTRLCVTLLNEAHARGHRRALFVHAPTLIQMQLEAINDGDRKPQANAWLERCRCAEPLGLDDVAGAEAGSDFSRRLLLVLYERRISAGLHTIWTSNLQLDQLAEFYGDDRLPSRWAEHAQVLEVAGSDWRVQPQRDAPAMRLLVIKGPRVS
jgi:DNA replication protein DnaC